MDEQQATVTPEVEATDVSVQPTDEPEKPKHHDRAGITKNHNRGQSKARRQMAKRSRRINRSK